MPPLGPWSTVWSRFAEKFDSEIVKISFRGLNETAEADFFC
jgi:hypothetical protein